MAGPQFLQLYLMYISKVYHLIWSILRKCIMWNRSNHVWFVSYVPSFCTASTRTRYRLMRLLTLIWSSPMLCTPSVTAIIIFIHLAAARRILEVSMVYEGQSWLQQQYSDSLQLQHKFVDLSRCSNLCTHGKTTSVDNVTENKQRNTQTIQLSKCIKKRKEV